MRRPGRGGDDRATLAIRFNPNWANATMSPAFQKQASITLRSREPKPSCCDHPRGKKRSKKIVQQEVKIVDINTTDPLDLQIILLDPSSDVQHHIKLKNDLFAGESRRKLFERQ
jgi:hypothetical protein